MSIRPDGQQLVGRERTTSQTVIFGPSVASGEADGRTCNQK
ncbi:hypothetical protein ACIGT4_26055 [Streptomyces sioyaensis]